MSEIISNTSHQNPYHLDFSEGPFKAGSNKKENDNENENEQYPNLSAWGEMALAAANAYNDYDRPLTADNIAEVGNLSYTEILEQLSNQFDNPQLKYSEKLTLAEDLIATEAKSRAIADGLGDLDRSITAWWNYASDKDREEKLEKNRGKIAELEKNYYDTIRRLRSDLVCAFSKDGTITLENAYSLNNTYYKSAPNGQKILIDNTPDVISYQQHFFNAQNYPFIKRAQELLQKGSKIEITPDNNSTSQAA